MRIKHEIHIFHTGPAGRMIGQVILIGKISLTIWTIESCFRWFGVFYNHVPIDTLRKFGNHITKFALIHPVSLSIDTVFNELVGVGLTEPMS